jgi:hypothetical protein
MSVNYGGGNIGSCRVVEHKIPERDSGSPVYRLSFIRNFDTVMAFGTGGDWAAYFAYPSKSRQIAADQVYCISGKVNSADKLYLVIESIKMDTKNGSRAQSPNPSDGAGG